MKMKDLALFHQSCDEQGRTVVLIKSKNGCIFGAFVGDSWQAHNSWVPSWPTVNESFLFTLKNVCGLEMTAFPLIEAGHAYGVNDGHAIYLGADILYDLETQSSNFNKFPTDYIDVSGAGKLLFTGSESSQVELFEVWKV